jgi:hypothetical protein
LNLSYLSRSTIFLLSTLLLFLILIGSLFLAFILLMMILGYLFLFRKRKSYFHEDQVTTSGNIYAPVSGKVLYSGEAQDSRKIIIKTNLFDEYGIYLPFSGKIRDIAFDDSSYSYRTVSSFDKNAQLNTFVELEDKKQRSLKIEFLRFFSGRAPELVVIPGDRGRRQVNIGFFPFGGITVLKLPLNSEQVAQKGDRVRATETIVARFNEEV